MNPISNLVKAAGGYNTNPLNLGTNGINRTSTPAFGFSGTKPNTTLNTAYGGPQNVPTGPATSQQPKITYSTPANNFSSAGISGPVPVSATSSTGTGNTLAAIGGSTQMTPDQQTAAGYKFNIYTGQPLTSNTQNTNTQSQNTGGTPGVYSQTPFGQTIKSLYDASNAQPAAPAISTLSGIATNQTPAVTQAQTDYNQFAQSSPYMQAAQYNPNVAADVASGRSALLGQTFAAELAAKQNAVSNAIAGQNSQVNAGYSAGSLGLTGQQQQQTGLNAILGATKPQLGSYGQTFYQPTEAGQSGTGNGGITTGSDMDNALNQYAKMAANGQIAGIPSEITSNPVLNAELNKRATVINPNYNPVTSSAQSGIITSQEQQKQQYQSALQQGQNLQAQLKDLITSFGLNPNDINALNSGLQKIASNTSDSRYKVLNNYINDIANTYSQILTPPGGAATDTTRSIAASMLDATASGTSIIDTMRSLDAAAQAKIAGVPTLTGQNNGASSGGNYTSASGNTYRLPY